MKGWCCRDSAAQASDYLDRQMSFWQRLRFRLHMNGCRTCVALVAELKAVASALRMLPTKHLCEERRAAILKAARERRGEATLG